jgi:hypothetical protein
MNKTIIAFGLVALTTFLSCSKEKEITGSEPPQSPSKKKPVAIAGGNLTVAAGCNIFLLDGSFGSFDQSSPILKWEQISGPNESIIVDPEKAKTLVTNVVTGTYQYVLKVKDANGTANDTTIVTILNTKEITVNNLSWENLLDDVFHIWAISIKRPDIFCDTLRIKQILVNNFITEPLWKVGTIQSFLEGTSNVRAGSGGYYYKYDSPEMLEVFSNGGIWGREATVKVIFE